MKIFPFLIITLLFTGCASQFVRYKGHKYPVVKAGNQQWLGENLQTHRFRWGARIQLIKNTDSWPELAGPACGYIESDTAKLSKYGMFYNWKAVEHGRLCPSKWEVPTNADWDSLEKFLGGDMRAGGRMKSIKGWKGKHISGDDIGFNAVAGGYRLNSDLQEGTAVVWWSSTVIKDKDLNSLVSTIGKSQTEQSENWIWGRRIENDESKLWTTANRPENGFYVRCVKKGK